MKTSIIVFITILVGLYIIGTTQSQTKLPTPPYTKAEAQEVIKDAAKTYNEKAPRRIDYMTVATRAEATDTSFAIYHQVDIEDLKDISRKNGMSINSIINYLKRVDKSTEQLCTGVATRHLIKAGMTVIRHYSTSEGTYMYKKVVSKWDCDNHKSRH